MTDQVAVSQQPGHPLAISVKITFHRILIVNAVFLESVISPGTCIIECPFHGECNSRRTVFGGHGNMRLYFLQFPYGDDATLSGAEVVDDSIAAVGDTTGSIFIISICFSRGVPPFHHVCMVRFPVRRKGVYIKKASRWNILELVFCIDAVIDGADKFFIDCAGGVGDGLTVIGGQRIFPRQKKAAQIVPLPDRRHIVGAIGVDICHGFESMLMQAFHALDITFARSPVGQFSVKVRLTCVPYLEHDAFRRKFFCDSCQHLVIRNGHIDVEDCLDVICPFDTVANGNVVFEVSLVPVAVRGCGSFPVALKDIQFQNRRLKFFFIFKRH